MEVGFAVVANFFFMVELGNMERKLTVPVALFIGRVGVCDGQENLHLRREEHLSRRG